MEQKNIKQTIVTVLVVLVLVYVLPVRNIRWGKLEFSSDRTVTVVGEAKQQVNNEIASFSAGVTAINDNKDVAVKEVNDKVAKLIENIKNFGIEEKDIKTSNLSIYQQEDYIEATRRSQPGQWRVSNNVEVILRQVERTSELVDLLAGSGATDVYGPNLRIDEESDAGDELFTEAVADARAKAEKAAEAAGAKLGKVVSMTEAGSSSVVPFYRAAAEGMGGGGAPIEPGSSQISKTVTVVFELR